jgi:hypothetical protein
MNEVCNALDSAGFNPENLLLRDCSITLPSADEHVVIVTAKAAGETLLDGKPLMTIRSVKSTKEGEQTVKEAVEREYLFTKDDLEEATFDHYTVSEGDRLAPGTHTILRYKVRDCFQNLIEMPVRAMAKLDSDLHFSNKIQKSKLSNAISAYAKSVDPDRVIFLYDETFFGSAKEGYLITDSGFYYKSSLWSASFRFNDIVHHELRTEKVISEDKTITKQVVVIVLQDDVEILIDETWAGLKLAELNEFISTVRFLKEKGLTKQVDGYVIVQDMPAAVKLCYAKLLVWLTYSGDGIIDEREVSELQVLMTQLNFDVELRDAVRTAIYKPQELNPEALFDEMLSQTPSGSELALNVSLLKDAVRIHRATSSVAAIEAPAVQRMAEIVGLNGTHLAFLEDVCIQDEKILAGDISDDQIVQSFKGAAAKASAVGIPITAVYLSGSVTGLSAAGITSGLASLGLGGILGFSSMVTGIGVVILLGVGAYKGFQWLSGGSERDKASRRELMLQEVLRVHQKAIANLAEDIAFFGRRLVQLSENVEVNRATIQKMSREITLFANALTQLRQRETHYEDDLKSEIVLRAA